METSVARQRQHGRTTGRSTTLLCRMTRTTLTLPMMRLALLDDWLDWQGELAQRCMVLAKVGRVTRCAPLLVTVVADTEQVYRAVECTVTYMALRSG